MTGSAFLTFIATILAVESGVVEIDLGSGGGLRPGDQGVVFYEVVVDGDVQEVDIGPASVIETASSTAKLEVASDLGVRPGFLVRVELPDGRAAERGVSRSGSGSVAIGSTAYVTNTGDTCLKLRSLPTTASPETGCLEEGTKVFVTKEVPDWSKTVLDDGRQGWLASRFLSGAAPGNEPRSRVELPAPRPRSQPKKEAVPRAEPPAPSAEVSLEKVNAAALLRELEQAEGQVRAQISQLAASQDAVLQAHETRSELSRRLFEATVAEFEARLAETGEQARFAENERAELAAAHDRLKEELEGANSEIRRVDAERLQLIERLQATSSELAQIEAIATAAKDALRQEIRTSQTTLVALRSRLEKRESELAEAEARLAAADAEHQAVADGAGGSVGDGRSGLRREAKELKRALMEAQREKEALEEWLDERGRELARAEAKVAIMQSEIDRLESIGPRNRREIENTRAALADASRRAADLEARLAASDEQNRAIEAQLAAAPGAPNAAQASESRPEQPITEREDLSSRDAGLGAEAVVLESAKPCLNFRAEPKLDSQAFDCLPPGTRLGPLGHWDSWHYVELTDGRAGWVASRHLGPVGLGGSGP